jgi:restriction endonuclease S subunit
MRVSLTQFKTLSFPKPPRPEQQRIGLLLKEADQLQKQFDTQVEKLAGAQRAITESILFQTS